MNIVILNYYIRSLLFGIVFMSVSNISGNEFLSSDHKKRKLGRSPELWRYYMHGITDFHAKKNQG